MYRSSPIHLLALWLLAIVFSCSETFAQTAGTTAPLVYTYTGQSAPTSLLDAISTAGAPARSLASAGNGSDTATAVVAPFPTTTTIGPLSQSGVRGSGVSLASGASGEVLSTATRPEFTISGTINTNPATGQVGASATPTSGAGRLRNGANEGSFAVMMTVVVGVVVGAAWVL